ncbi:MAG: major facilitator superfamily 1 [Eubacterium sp.]|jgi:FLVCR family MFS transporter 7|nr:major facilitator superfamily 1 [Eubacterium sp.]
MTKGNGLSPFRWLIVLAIIPIIISTEMMWLSLAPISSMAENYYGVGGMSIALFSMSYMIMYIIFSVPASWIVDKYGFRYSLIIGAAITAVFGLVRALFANNFTIVLTAQFMIAVGQPFLLNISTKVPANWFPVSERSTAAGLLTMAQYIGFALPMVLAPVLAGSKGIPYTLMVFAVIGILSALCAILFTRERPRVALSGPEAPREDLSFAAIKNLFLNKAFLLVLYICLISMGIFNTILTLIEQILLPRGIATAQAGIVGAVFVISGVIGAVILPIISDRLGKRTPFFVTAIALLIPVYLGLTFLDTFVLVAILAGIAGFSIMGVAPVLFQHGSEVAYPIQEGTSLGIILLMGQISGALFVYLFELFQSVTASVTWPMLGIVVLTAAVLPAALRIKESKLVKQSEAFAAQQKAINPH